MSSIPAARHPRCQFDDASAFADRDSRPICQSCACSSACIAVGYGEAELAALSDLVEHVGRARQGDHLFRTGDPFRAIIAVRSGTVKTCVVDREGREQVLGFYLPGELIGLDAIYPGRFPSDAIALENTEFCRFPFSSLSALATRQPAVQLHLFRLLSKGLGAAGQLAGDHAADERMAAFLVDLGSRYAARGFSGTRFKLSMSRGDIANYLRLAPETVSRVLTRFRSQQLIELEGRNLDLRETGALQRIGERLLPD